MFFENREEAARKLVERLQEFRKAKNAILVALPRGGVVLGGIIADTLELPLDIVVPRKIGMPWNEEYAIGALTETGEIVWNEKERASVSQKEIEKIVEKEKAEAKRRLETYRKGMPKRNLKNKTVILIDDGIATGYTMRAAIKSVKTEGAKRVVVAVPICPPDILQKMQTESDQFITLDTPVDFMAIGQYYRDFPQVEDEAVINILSNQKKRLK